MQITTQQTQCVKCGRELPSGAEWCPWCGRKQTRSTSTRRRSNGTGSIFRRGSGYIALKIIGHEIRPDGTRRRITKSKSGLRTRKEAEEWLHSPELQEAAGTKRKTAYTFQQLYDLWEPTHKRGASTMNCYRAALRHLGPIRSMKMGDIDIDDIQDCFDDDLGRRTQENMKTLCGLVYKFGIPRHAVPDNLNLSPFIVLGGQSGAGKAGLPLEALDRLWPLVDRVDCVNLILCQCYLGFRPSELLALRIENYDRTERAFTGGSKTDAGTDRLVTVSPKIQPLIDAAIGSRSTGPVFCHRNGQPISLKEYRTAFYSALTAAGIDNPVFELNGVQRHTYTPHSCRHTFATLLKRIDAPDKDKLELMGHTSTAMLRHYQDVAPADLRRITDAL